jgi:hypothetical protein
MPLPAPHERIVRAAMQLPAPNLALAGGGAMLAHDLVGRVTNDVDLFSSDPADIDRVAHALTATLRAAGDEVDVERTSDTFTRLVVRPREGDTVIVELAFDARMRPAVELSFGRVLDRDELAADKTLALFGRAAARDLVDVHALLAHGYTRSDLLRLAAEKDPGFHTAALRDALNAAASRDEADFASLGLEPAQTDDVRRLAADWRAHIAPSPPAAAASDRWAAMVAALDPRLVEAADWPALAATLDQAAAAGVDVAGALLPELTVDPLPERQAVTELRYRIMAAVGSLLPPAPQQVTEETGAAPTRPPEPTPAAPDRSCGRGR